MRIQLEDYVALLVHEPIFDFAVVLVSITFVAFKGDQFIVRGLEVNLVRPDDNFPSVKMVKLYARLWTLRTLPTDRAIDCTLDIREILIRIEQWVYPQIEKPETVSGFS